MATGTGAAQTQQNRTAQNTQQRHTLNISLPANWGYQEYGALNWVAGQLSLISSQYLVGFSGGQRFTVGTAQSGMTGGQNSAVNGETAAATEGNQPERRGRRKMTPAQRAAHTERMRAVAARRKQERAAAQAPQKTKGKTAAAGAG